MNYFAFVQVDLAGSTGIDDGRYPVRAIGVRDGETEQVLVVRTLGLAPPPRFGRRKKAKDADTEAGPQMPMTRLIVVGATPLNDPEAWLESVRESPEELSRQAEPALECIDRALAARRLVTADPVALGAAGGAVVAIRVGYGRGDDLVEGRFAEAVDMPIEARRRRRTEMLRPQERFAALLGSREEALACEELLLRARADVDAGRSREAALQLRVGLEALLAAREAFTSTKQADDLAELDGHRQITGDAANEALKGHLRPERRAQVEGTLEICERILRRRAAYGS